MEPARQAGTVEGGEGVWERGMEGEGGAVGQEGKAAGLPQEAPVIKAIRQVLCHGDELPEVSRDPKDIVSPNGMGKRDEAGMQVHTVTLTRPVINDRGQDVVEKVVSSSKGWASQNRLVSHLAPEGQGWSESLGD